jgi:sulfonate transport system substrate-binding protein
MLSAEQNLFVEGRDLELQITSWLVTRKFAAENSDLVRAVNAASAAEAEWASTHPEEAEHTLQKIGKYGDAVRDSLITKKRRYPSIPLLT